MNKRRAVRSIVAIAVFAALVFLATREREQCPPDQVWVWSDNGWLCLRR